ncbi:integral membrane protein [Aspergillus eucalypticola CBS 122712]|uniref:Integral membrane protein n=1 Tax=Aspergillus eucalypticola (strain CBS 122712 / IBT 29274) TaxID=1448314 RepID=A0A317WKF8_ASPEC|nr:uncharacterized protein BO83DRAFT_443438 [Aspergillus eucalypticola CBS 122712]PWY85558.1 integral membrane protein [Aspergillus eucalypticola CBS 122712]
MSAPPAGGDQNRGPALVAIYWAETSFAILAVALRLYGRKLINGFGADDYMMVFTLLLFITLAAFVTYLADKGGCRHLYYLTTDQQLLVVKFNWITQVWGIFGFATGKSSVALQIKRILGPNDNWMKWLLWFLMISTIIFCGLDCLFGFVQCDPPRALWEPWIPHTCWDTNVQANFAIFISAWNVLVDLVLAAIPIPIIWRTSLTLKQRIATCTLLGLGPVAAAFGLVKIQYLAGLKERSDLTWQTYNLYVWSGSELFVIIICGCVPPMRPVFTTLFGQNKSQFTGYYDSSSGYKRRQSYKLSTLGSSQPVQSQDEDTEALHSRVEGTGSHLPQSRFTEGGIYREVNISIVEGPK